MIASINDSLEVGLSIKNDFKGNICVTKKFFLGVCADFFSGSLFAKSVFEDILYKVFNYLVKLVFLASYLI